MDEWRARLLESPADVARVVRTCRRVAVLGIKPESRADRPAHHVPAYLARHGYDVVPVPVYYPEVTTILGRPVYRRVRDVAPPPDLVCVFRRPGDIPPHLPDLLAARPRVVWFQQGIRHDAAAETLARAGIEVVQDRCLMVEHQRLGTA
jgi:predicted CoA-binding protein